jgi:hypothetical protein
MRIEARSRPGEGLTFVQRFQDHLDDTVGVGQDFIVPEPDDTPTLPFQQRGPPLISLAVCVLPAVGFDNQAVLRASEIDDEFTYWVLPTKTITRQTPIAQDRP